MIVDSSDVVRAGLAGVLRSSDWMDIVGESGNAQQAVSLALELKPDVAILDIDPPPSDGVQLVEQIRQVSEETRVLVFTARDCVTSMKQLFAAGVSGYLVKEASGHEIKAAVRAVAEGRAFFSLTWQDAMFRLENGHGEEVCQPDSLVSHHGLSEREAEVLIRVARGMTNQQIADQLYLSVKTIETYRSRVAKKIGAHSRADIFRFAQSAGLLEATAT